MANAKAKIKVKVTPKKGKAIRPKMGKGTGGILTARIIADVRKKKNK